MKKRLRILMFPAWFPGQTHPLNAIFTKKHLDIISKFHDIVVAYQEKQFNQDKLSIINNYSYPVIRTYYKVSAFKLVNLVRKFYAVIKAQNLAINSLKGVDIIHIHVVDIGAIILWFYSVFHGIPIFVSEHSTQYLEHHREHALQRFVRKLIFKRCKGISAVSKSLKNVMENRGYRNSNFLIIHNAVDFDVFRQIHKEDSEKIRFVHVSRLDEQAKNVIGILRVFDQLAAVYPNIELHIVGGDGRTRFPSELFREKLKSKARIFFKGIKLGIDMAKEYQSADFLVMFSNYETQGVVVMESLACGKPVIATNLPCLTEYLHAGNSILVKPKDEQALFNAMETCVLNKNSFWDSSIISSEIKNKFSEELIIKKFNQLYFTGLSLND